MKNIILAAASALLVFAVAPIVGKAAPQPTSMPQQSETQQKKTFSGTITKSGDVFVLTDPVEKTAYVLDDSNKASQFEGKKVKVTGTVNMETYTIHVETIKEAA